MMHKSTQNLSVCDAGLKGEGMESPSVVGKYRAYPEYKDSQIEWSGSIPDGWDCRRLKYQVSLVTEKAKSRTNPIGLENLSSWTGKFLITGSEFQGEGTEFESGDILFGKLRPYLAKVFLAERGGEAVGDFHVLRPVEGYGEYLQQVMLTKEFISIVDGSTFGARMPRASWEFMSNLVVPVPSSSEQQTIANFLDHETAKIDILIDKQQQLIQLLKEKRQAAISKAVTKGLDLNVPMKDSGVEWLGEVPEHWTVLSLGKITLDKCDGPFGSGLKSSHYTETGVRVIRLQNIKSRGYYEGEGAFIDEAYYKNNLSNHDVIPDDILIAGLGDPNNPVGRACVAPFSISPAMVKADCFRFRLDTKKGKPGFIAYQLNTSARIDAGRLSNGSTRARIPLSLMASRKVAVCPINEQIEIASYLDAKLSKYDQLELKAVDVIALLKERRTALISAAVTGKIDVRNW